MTTASDRLRTARERAGFRRAADAATRFDWPKSTYYGHENGSRKIQADVAALYARAFKCSPEWLLYGRGNAENTSSRDATIAVTEDDAPVIEVEAKASTLPTDAGLVQVYNVVASAGFGSVVESEINMSSLAFPPGYLDRLTSTHPRNLAIISVKGDSMAPTLSDDDVVMLDLTKRDLSFDGLFVIRDDGDGLLIKRIGRASRRGYVMMIPDNSAYPPVERLTSDIEVVGRVIWVGRKV